MNICYELLQEVARIDLCYSDLKVKTAQKSLVPRNIFLGLTWFFVVFSGRFLLFEK